MENTYIYQIVIRTGEVVGRFNDTKEASEATGIKEEYIKDAASRLIAGVNGFFFEAVRDGRYVKY